MGKIIDALPESLKVPATDREFAKLLASKIGENARFVPELKKWMLF